MKPVRALPGDDATPPGHGIDTSFLESLVGYNARRASLTIIALFMQRMAPYALRPVEFSVLSLIKGNPGITARQICKGLGLLPPNLVGMLKGLEQRGLVQRQAQPQDKRAFGLRLSTAGRALMFKAEASAAELELDATAALSAGERRTLMRLLQKVYRQG